jgi:hypothetical protein
VELGAAFHEEQAEAGAGARANVASAMERFEKLLLILFGNTYTAIGDDTDGFGTVRLDFKTDGVAGLGIFHRVAKEVGEDVTEQLFIRIGEWWNGVQREFDKTTAVCG